MSLSDFFNYHIYNLAWCIRKGFPKRMVMCDVWFRDIPVSTKFMHPYGITIRKGVKIGENCIFASNVTIGGRRDEEMCAIIGNNVFFGTGCVVLGEITIGNNVKVGAGTVVLRDIPEGSTVISKREGGINYENK